MYGPHGKPEFAGAGGLPLSPRSRQQQTAVTSATEEPLLARQDHILAGIADQLDDGVLLRAGPGSTFEVSDDLVQRVRSTQSMIICALDTCSLTG